MNIRNTSPSDAVAIAEIYNYYIATSTATFEEEPVSVSEMSSRIDAVQSKYAWLVCELDGNVVGYAYAAPWKARSAYRFTAELSVYIHKEHTGKGLGRELYSALLEFMQTTDVHSVIGGVADNNTASDSLHASFGFERIGRFSGTGFKFGRWIDVTYWQKVLQA